MPVPQLERYLARLRYFCGHDRGCPDMQREIAWEQIAGQFEWAYSAQLTQEVWGGLLGAWPRDRPVPSRTSDAAHLVIAIVGRAKSETTDSPGGTRRTVDFSDCEELDREADLFYSEQMAEEGLGIGGRNVLLACSLERSGMSGAPGSASRVTLLGLDVLGIRKIQPGERTGDFIDAIRSGRIMVRNVTGR
jgi:hypothetical protein